uniref:Uncharacterized protein n=1 Tax=Arion vulgaris TaxID=1028688 RepID=A0A0B7A6K8_9EUPU
MPALSCPKSHPDVSLDHLLSDLIYMPDHTLLLLSLPNRPELTNTYFVTSLCLMLLCL